MPTPWDCFTDEKQAVFIFYTSFYFPLNIEITSWAHVPYELMAVFYLFAVC